VVPFAAIHPAALIEAAAVPAGSAVGAYARVGPAVELEGPCAIGEQAILAGRVRVAAGAEIGPQAYLEGPITIETGARIAARCSLDAGGAEPIVLRESVVIGANSTIWPGVTVGKGARVEPGSVVTKNVPAMAVVAGNPAGIVRYSGVPNAPAQAQIAATAEVTATAVRGVTLRRLPLHEDLRGNLTFGEAARHVPFAIQRYFLSFAVAGEQVRGEHAHRSLHQFLIAAHGRVHIVADDGVNQADFLLDRPDLGVHIPPMIWSVQYRFSADAVLLALCSEPYDPADYIRDYAEFLALARSPRA
jgi:UDP-2-acetamido-3-amino-2,3-dideoxy-glucuronate N-acetyltransferase